jgi:hypothetical protein
MAHFSHRFNSILTRYWQSTIIRILIVPVFQDINSIHTSFPVTWHED